jgi:uncharacterized protein (TIGR00297 family)
VTGTIRRAGAFAAVGTLSLAAPALGVAAAAPFAAVALVALVVTDGPFFDLFARPGDHKEGRLRGLAGFALAATGLALLIPLLELPVEVFASVVVLVSYGNLAEQVARSAVPREIVGTIGFVAGGFVAGLAGQLLARWLATGSWTTAGIADFAFLAASGAVLAALLRSVLFERDDPLVLFSVGLLLWLFVDLAVSASPTQVALALVVTGAFGYASWALDTASIPGMLTGVLLALLTIVLGGFGWFVVLIAFFAIGGLATKYRYDEKQSLGVAEANGGARGSGNVLGNAAVALFAVIAFAAGPRLPVPREVFLFAFAGSIATALSDTLSSELGCVFDDPRLITTFERVEPGTDGAITWQGELAGLAGAAVIAVTALALFDGVGTLGAAAITLAGLGGMTADSLFGATLEGEHLGNQGVNFLATLTGAALCAVAVLAAGPGTLS